MSSIKYIFLLLFVSSFLWGQDDPVLLTIDEHPVHLSEFTYIYEKNNGNEADYSKASVDEYLDLFTNFKLKVHKAKELKMDTIEALRQELAGYRRQLAFSYLMEKELSDRLIDEMYERRKEDVNISHILYKTRRNASDREIESAIQKALEAYQKIQNGASFEALALTESDDKTTASNGGNLGWITSWLPSGFYNLENAAYNTSIEGISEPVVSKLGVHLVKVLDRRPAYGKIEVAHILVRHDSKRTKDPEAHIKKIHDMLLSNRPFDKVAMTMSEDKATATEGGLLKPFGINTFDRQFEEAAFSIKNNGDISDPVKTKIGWHIIKRISKPSESYEEFKARMKPELPKLDRYKIIQDILVEEIKESVDFKYNEELITSLKNNLGEDFFSYSWQIPQDLDQGILFEFGESGLFSLEDFAKYVKSNTKSRMKYNKEKNAQDALELIFEEYVQDISMSHYEKELIRKYPDFKALMREYSEGILLFEISKEQIWDRASKDTTGLEEFYKKNKNNYFHPTSALVSKYSFSINNDNLVKDIYQYASDNSAEKTKEKFNRDREILIVEQSEVEVLQLEKEGLKSKAGAISPLLTNPNNNLTSFKKVEKIIPLRIKPLNESRGYVIADYQQYLEKQWVKSLKKDYKVEIKEDVLDRLIK